MVDVVTTRSTLLLGSLRFLHQLPLRTCGTFPRNVNIINTLLFNKLQCYIANS